MIEGTEMIGGSEVRGVLSAAAGALDALLEDLEGRIDDVCRKTCGTCMYCDAVAAHNVVVALLVKMDRQRHAIENTGKKDEVAP